MGEIERHDYSEINQLLKALRGARLSASRGLVVRHFFSVVKIIACRNYEVLPPEYLSISSLPRLPRRIFVSIVSSRVWLSYAFHPLLATCLLHGWLPSSH